jgi:hypothetical protein
MRCISAALLLVLGASPAFAQSAGAPEIVIPGRPDVPVFINGVDASWAIVEGDFGLDRPGQVTPTIIYRVPPPVLPYAYNLTYGEPAYYPSSGRHPGYGRLEVVPRERHIPPPAPTYFHSWSSDSAPLPANDGPAGSGAGMGAPIFNGAPMGAAGCESQQQSLGGRRCAQSGARGEYGNGYGDLGPGGQPSGHRPGEPNGPAAAYGNSGQGDQALGNKPGEPNGAAGAGAYGNPSAGGQNVNSQPDVPNGAAGAYRNLSAGGQSYNPAPPAYTPWAGGGGQRRGGGGRR